MITPGVVGLLPSASVVTADDKITPGMSVVWQGSGSYDVINFLIGSMNMAVVAEISEESQSVDWAKGCSHRQREEAPRRSWG